MFVHRFGKIAAAAVLFGATSAAQASIMLSFTDSGTGNVVTCSTVTGTCAGAGFASFTDIVSDNTAPVKAFSAVATNWFGWNIGIAGASGTGATGTGLYLPNQATLNIDVFSITRVGPGTGTLFFDAVGMNYTMPPAPAKSWQGSSSMIYQSGPTLSATSNLFTRFYANEDDLAPFPAQVALDECTAITGSTVNDRSCSRSGNWTDAGAPGFSLRLAQAIRLEEGQNVKTQASLTTQARVPEPMTLSLVGAALLGAAVVSRRRARKA